MCGGGAGAAAATGATRRVLGAETEPISTLTINLLREELQELGGIEGRNLRLGLRFGNGDASQTRVFAADLV
jgi:hypothetical protein